MLKRNFNLDRATLEDMYLQQNLKVAEIANIMGCSLGLVSKRLKESGIRKEKSIISAQVGASKQKFRLTEGEFRDLYLVQKKTMYEVAEIAGVSHSLAAAYAGRMGIKKPRREVTPADIKMREEFPLDEAALRSMYIEQDMTVSMIASMVGFSVHPIRARLKKLGIAKHKQHTRVRADRVEMQRMFLEEGLTVRQIAERIGCGHTAISDHIKKYGLTGLKGAKTRLILADGYVLVSILDANGSVKYIPEHRIVAEKGIGRGLAAVDMVHHINMKKADNRIENLAILTKTEHRTVHAYMERLCAYQNCGGDNPDPLVFEQEVFWGGKYITQLDLIGDRKPLTFTDAFKAAYDLAAAPQKELPAWGLQ